MILPTLVWLRTSVLWVALLSIYALVLTAGGAERAAEAAAEVKNANESEAPNGPSNSYDIEPTAGDGQSYVTELPLVPLAPVIDITLRIQRRRMRRM